MDNVSHQNNLQLCSVHRHQTLFHMGLITEKSYLSTKRDRYVKAVEAILASIYIVSELLCLFTGVKVLKLADIFGL